MKKHYIITSVLFAIVYIYLRFGGTWQEYYHSLLFPGVMLIGCPHKLKTKIVYIFGIAFWSVLYFNIINYVSILWSLAGGVIALAATIIIDKLFVKQNDK